MDFTKPSPAETEAFYSALPKDATIVRGPMFGLPHAKVGGNAFAGRHIRGVTLRLPDGDRVAAMQQGAVPFEPMPGRPMKDWVLLPANLAAKASLLERWLLRAFEHASTLPKKSAKKAAAKKKPTPRKRA